MKAELVFGIRVKLEDGIDPVAILEKYRASSTGGEDPNYIAMRDAIFEAKPNGFEVHWARKSRPWPVDSAGYTFVPLYVTDSKLAHVSLVEQICNARKEIEWMRDLAKKMLRLT